MLPRRRIGLIGAFLGLFLAPLSMGGCEMECDCQDNDVKDAIDEVGDEVQETIDKAKDDK